jgi:ribonuclease HII
VQRKPELIEKYGIDQNKGYGAKRHLDGIKEYGIDQNKGYGAKRHLDGIKEYGISIWHRRSFSICKQYQF